jgi:hypothetical protein
MLSTMRPPITTKAMPAARSGRVEAEPVRGNGWVLAGTGGLVATVIALTTTVLVGFTDPQLARKVIEVPMVASAGTVYGKVKLPEASVTAVPIGLWLAVSGTEAFGGKPDPEMVMVEPGVGFGLLAVMTYAPLSVAQ